MISISLTRKWTTKESIVYDVAFLVVGQFKLTSTVLYHIMSFSSSFEITKLDLISTVLFTGPSNRSNVSLGFSFGRSSEEKR